jgi:hypothetical protein
MVSAEGSRAAPAVAAAQRAFLNGVSAGLVIAACTAVVAALAVADLARPGARST